MERMIHDVKVYAATVVEDMVKIAEKHNDVLTPTEVETIHDAALLILHNIKDIVRE